MSTVCVNQCFPFMFFLPKLGNISNNWRKEKICLWGISFSILLEGACNSATLFSLLKTFAGHSARSTCSYEGMCLHVRVQRYNLDDPNLFSIQPIFKKRNLELLP